MEIDNAKQTYTVGEAAEALGIGRGLAYDLVAQGKIPHLRLGRRIVIPKAALDRILGEGGRIQNSTDE